MKNTLDIEYVKKIMSPRKKNSLSNKLKKRLSLSNKSSNDNSSNKSSNDNSSNKSLNDNSSNKSSKSHEIKKITLKTSKPHSKQKNIIMIPTKLSLMNPNTSVIPDTSEQPNTSSEQPDTSESNTSNTSNTSSIMERDGSNNSNIENSNFLPDKPYGCLKGGSKPTFRQYHNKTFKKKSLLPDNKIPILERQKTLNDLKKSYKKIKQTKRKTKKTIYNLGRTERKISVLIKNNSTRRKIKREYGLLKQKSLNDIKKHLYEKNLIKIGSTAPNDVLRTIYEQSILAGDVTNTSGDIQIHNFINK